MSFLCPFSHGLFQGWLIKRLCISFSYSCVHIYIYIYIYKKSWKSWLLNYRFCVWFVVWVFCWFWVFFLYLFYYPLYSYHSPCKLNYFPSLGNHKLWSVQFMYGSIFFFMNSSNLHRYNIIQLTELKKVASPAGKYIVTVSTKTKTNKNYNKPTKNPNKNKQNKTICKSSK